MKEALYYKKLECNKVQCVLCPHNCIILPNKVGICGVRENQDGKLVSLVYGHPCSMNVDPIEKKPLFHFLPGAQALSIGTVGCNLKCLHCQNWEISRAKPDKSDSRIMEPEEIINICVEKKIPIIAYTYNEPTIFFEYMLDIAKLAKKKGIKNAIVSNGFTNPEPLDELCKFMDAANIDLKGFDDNFYKEICKAKLQPVLDALKIYKKNKVWLEITNLVIPTKNDNMKEIERMIIWIRDNLGKDVPLHFSRFFPYCELSYLSPTPEHVLLSAQELGRQYLDFVYVGNLRSEEGENTMCPKCKKTVVKRSGYAIVKIDIKDGKCKFCGQMISGVWQ